VSVGFAAETTVAPISVTESTSMLVMLVNRSFILAELLRIGIPLKKMGRTAVGTRAAHGP
jgi:hypothetical protein